MPGPSHRDVSSIREHIHQRQEQKHRNSTHTGTAGAVVKKEKTLRYVVQHWHPNHWNAQGEIGLF